MVISFLALSTACAASDAWFEAVERKFSFASPDDAWRARVSGLMTLEGYQLEQPPPGLLFTEGDALFNPRLVLYLDAQQGPALSAFAQVRVDRGFDPGTGHLRGRLDEYALRVAPWADARCSVQVGQFATVIGNWVGRHDARDNPFVTAPLPYEHLTAIYDAEAPASREAFVFPAGEERYDFNPIVWGPAYATGVAVSGRRGRFDLSVEVKNTGPSARPEAWSITRTGFDHPAYAARVGFRPDLRWNFGFSASDSAYFRSSADRTLPAGTGRGDFRERLFAHDARFAWRHLQVWAEAFHATFDVPRVGTVRTTAAYLETKYKWTPQLYSALRVNRQVFSNLDTARGSRPWSPSLWRFDTALGYRFSAYIDLKLQASAQHEDGGSRHATLHYAAQLNVRF